jgi:hypothetical protein
MLTTLSALLATASAAVLLPPNPAQRWIEPFPYLSGGAFSGAQLPFCADPLGTYQWELSVNASQLQVRVGGQWVPGVYHMHHVAPWAVVRNTSCACWMARLW